MTVYAAHQPDLLPYSGFFYKLARADLFEIKVFDQIQGKPGYQRRVKMRDKWVSLPLLKHSAYDPINEVRIDPDKAPQALIDQIIKTYRNPGDRTTWAKHWDEHGDWLIETIKAARTDRLWAFNTDLIIHVARRLGIDLTMAFTRAPLTNRGAPGVVEAIKQWTLTPPVTYLSGRGGAAYMGDCSDFTAAGIEVAWVDHAPVTGDSIVTLLLDHDNPRDLVLAEHKESEHA